MYRCIMAKSFDYCYKIITKIGTSNAYKKKKNRLFGAKSTSLLVIE